MAVSSRPYRLRNDDPRSWAYFPVFEARCLAFIQKHKIEFDIALFSAELRQRFNDPTLDRHRLYVFLDRELRIIGHFLAWLDVAYGQPYLHVNQIAVDQGASISETMPEMFAEMDAWAEALNKNVPPGQPRIQGAEFWTWHDPAVFTRYLRPGCNLKISRYVLRYDLDGRRTEKNDAARELH